MGHYDNCRDGYCAVCGQVAVSGTPYCTNHIEPSVGPPPSTMTTKLVDAALLAVLKKYEGEKLTPEVLERLHKDMTGILGGS